MKSAPRNHGVWLTLVVALAGVSTAVLATAATNAEKDKKPITPVKSPAPGTTPTAGSTVPQEDPARTHTGDPTT